MVLWKFSIDIYGLCADDIMRGFLLRVPLLPLSSFFQSLGSDYIFFQRRMILNGRKITMVDDTLHAATTEGVGMPVVESAAKVLVFTHARLSKL